MRDSLPHVNSKVGHTNSGIEIGDRGQVENCVVGDAEPGAGVDGNGGFGIVGGSACW